MLKSDMTAIHAGSTWQMISRRGIIEAVDHVVWREAESMGYAALIKMGMQDKAFEAVVLRHPKVFSDEAVRRSRERLQIHGQDHRGTT